MISQIMENGGCVVQDATNFPKYKRRKVSAVRDFPSGCGPNAPRINVSPLKHSNVAPGGQKSLKGYEVESKLDSHTAVTNECLQSKTFELAKVENEVSIDPSFERATSPDVFHSPLQLKCRKYPPRRKFSAIRDFPRFCGRDAPQLTKDECIKARGLSKHGSVSHVNDIKDVKPNENLKYSSLESGDNANADGNAKHKTLIPYIMSDEIDGGFGKEIVVYSHGTENYSSDTILEDEIRGCHMEVHAVDDGVGKEIVLGSEGSGSRGQHLIASENFAKQVNVHSLQAEPNSSDIAVQKGDKHLRNDRLHSHKNAVDRVIVHALKSPSRSRETTVDFDDKYSRREYSPVHKVDSEVVYGLMAAPNCPWRQSKGVNLTSHSSFQKCRGLTHGSSSSMTKSKVKKLLEERRKNKAQKNYIEATPLRSTHPYEMTMEGNELHSEQQDEGCHSFYGGNNTLHIDLPPVVPDNVNMRKDSNHSVSHNKVKETLRLFQAVFRKLMHKEEETVRRGATASKRIDLDTAKLLKDQGKYVNTVQRVGPVPGVDVGLEFQFRVELAIVGLHRLYQAGIDYMKQGGTLIATSIVASGGYADDMDSSDVLIYSGSGGNPTKGDKKAEDQKLERGNLALKNSIAAKNPVRVIRGHDHKTFGGKARTVKTYTYDGLYVVTKYWQKPGPNGNLVYMFRLERIPGQPELAWNMIKNSKKSNIRRGVCVQDISEGKEQNPICAVNTIDDQKPPSFKYITSMLYPDWCRPLPLRGCNCVNACSDSASCSCAVRNNGEIPYNNNGAIVQVKPLVYECGPSCKCPPSCPNRVSQLGIRFQLEIFKTESRGWGVRSLNYIPSGSFICEYLGELLDDKQAEQRIGSDEYLFDIGSNFSDQTLLDEFSDNIPVPQIGASEVVDDVGFTIDAERYGNVGRFINHSCSPNLYAQNVLYDHEDTRMPHIMLFAADNIPALQELTYHYNYNIGEVRDSNGNVKIKHCYCGSADCTGRLY